MEKRAIRGGHDMTDNDIIKALDCCQIAESILDCEKLKCPILRDDECRFFTRSEKDGLNAILTEMCKESLAYINRQKAEIERLEKANKSFADLGKLYSEIRAEAIKEFAERLKVENFTKFFCGQNTI